MKRRLSFLITAVAAVTLISVASAGFILSQAPEEEQAPAPPAVPFAGFGVIGLGDGARIVLSGRGSEGYRGTLQVEIGDRWVPVDLMPPSRVIPVR